MSYDLSTATADSVRSATEAAIADADALVASAVDATDSTYTARITPLDDAVGLIGDVAGYGPFLANFHTDKDVRDAGNEARAILENWSNDLLARRDVYDAVMVVDPESVDGLERRALDEWRRDLRRAGHALSDGDRAAVLAKRQRLTELEVQFNQNIAEFQDHLDVPLDDFAGMPPHYVEGLADGDAPGTKRVTLEYPDYFPFMDESPNRESRRQLSFKYNNRAVEANRPLLEEAIRLRHEIAELLGYADWAAYAMEVKMADPTSVDALYASVIPGLTKLGEDEKALLQAMLHEDVDDRLERWDWRYYHNQQQRRDYGVDQNEVAEYFPLERVVQGMLDVTSEVLGVTYVELPDLPTWHDDVRSYRIDDTATGEPMAIFHLDLHPRDGKFTHAACWNPVSRKRDADGSLRIPVAAVATNFPKPSGDTPSLLKHDDAVTLWHEFGHVLHATLTEVDDQRFSGFDVEWDFVEAPSQIMENWMWDATVLSRFARHYETGDPIPDELVSSLVAARDQNIGLTTLRQVYLGQYDLAMHTSGPEPDLDELHTEAHGFTLMPEQDDTFMAAAFGHLLGGYDAGYYGYLWAHVYGDDMFSVFEQEGVLSPEVGMRYRKAVLARGSSVDAWDMLQDFLGREPNADAFLTKLGIGAA